MYLLLSEKLFHLQSHSENNSYVKLTNPISYPYNVGRRFSILVCVRCFAHFIVLMVPSSGEVRSAISDSVANAIHMTILPNSKIKYPSHETFRKTLVSPFCFRFILAFHQALVLCNEAG